MKLDAEKEGKAAAEKHGVDGYPTILFLDGDEKVVAKIAGYLPPKPFADQMTRVLDMRENFPKWQAAVKANPKDVDSIVKLGMAYAMQNDRMEAMRMAEMASKAAPEGQSDQLADLYNAVGDMFQGEGRYFFAMEFFNGAATRAKDPAKMHYARMSMGYCYLALGQARNALDLAEAGLKTAGLSEEDKRTYTALKNSAERMLAAQPKA